MVMKGHYEFTLLLLDYTKTTCQLIFTCFNLEGGDKVIKDTKY